jgi:hypothetical protein
MRAAEVMNSPHTVDAAIDPRQPVDDPNLEMVVEWALDQVSQLTLERQQTARRIAITRRIIHGLALLYRDFERRPEDGAAVERRRGITNPCRVVLNRAERPRGTAKFTPSLSQSSPRPLPPTRKSLCFAYHYPQ